MSSPHASLQSPSLRTSQEPLQGGEGQNMAQEFTQRMMHVQQHCMADFASQLNEAKLSYAQYYLLGVLAQVEGLGMGEIAERMGHSTAAATGLVDRLEGLDFVGRRTSTKDRRRILVAITENGKERLEKLNTAMVNSVARLLAEEKA